jgi:hypothetical protein
MSSSARNKLTTPILQVLIAMLAGWIKEEALNRMVIMGEASLRHVLPSLPSRVMIAKTAYR